MNNKARKQKQGAQLNWLVWTKRQYSPNENGKVSDKEGDISPEKLEVRRYQKLENFKI